jgi:uncharacterized protein (DUF486 family)
MRTVILLVISNAFMTYAWYGHLKHRDWPMWLAILSSWLIAFVEYCFAVPANRLGFGTYTVTQLKIMQEVITLAVFTVFALLSLRETWRWNYLISFACLIAAVYFAFKR